MSLDGYEWKSDFAIQHRAEGRAKGMAEVLVRVLGVLGIYVDDDARERITACTDLNQLEMWIERSVKIEAVDELFE